MLLECRGRLGWDRDLGVALLVYVGKGYREEAGAPLSHLHRTFTLGMLNQNVCVFKSLRLF